MKFKRRTISKVVAGQESLSTKGVPAKKAAHEASIPLLEGSR